MPTLSGIVQVVPAPGWTAVYAPGGSDEHHVPLAAWALRGPEGEHAVIGLLPARADGRSIELVDESDPEFVRYEYVREVLHH